MRTLTYSIIGFLLTLAFAIAVNQGPLTPYQTLVNQKLSLPGVTGYHPIGEDGFWIQFSDGYHLEIYERKGMEPKVIQGR